MTFTDAFLAVSSLIGLLGFAILLVATVVTSAAELTGHDLADLADRRPLDRAAIAAPAASATVAVAR